MADPDLSQPFRCSACGAATPLTAVCTWITTEAQLDAFVDETSPPAKCPQCGAPFPDLPAVLAREGWAGVVLANPQRVTVFEADTTVSALLARLNDGGRVDCQLVLAVGRRQQMRKILRAGPKDRFQAVSFTHLGCGDWVNQLESLMVLFDCYLQNDRPLQAFGLLCEACNEIKELVLHPRVFEAMELALAVARTQDLAAEQRSGMEGDFAQVQTLYRGFYAQLSPTAGARYLCFFPRDSDFQPHASINYLVELVAMDRSGCPDFKAAELHATNEPMQALLQDKPTLLEWAMLELFVLGVWAGMPDGIRARLPLLDQTQLRATLMGFSGHWSAVQSHGRYTLYKRYQERSGGRDLVMDFDLPPEGIYLTIDRIESRAPGGSDD
jgi:hypothetical protein